MIYDIRQLKSSELLMSSLICYLGRAEGYYSSERRVKVPSGIGDRVSAILLNTLDYDRAKNIDVQMKKKKSR
jgi:hypothetical protein